MTFLEKFVVDLTVDELKKDNWALMNQMYAFATGPLDRALFHNNNIVHMLQVKGEAMFAQMLNLDKVRNSYVQGGPN